MQIFLYEFSYFLAASLAILVSISAFALFILTFRYERKLQTVWRALGFLLLALAFLILIWERKEPSISLLAVILQAFALFSIYRGVAKEPRLVHLIEVPSSERAMERPGLKLGKEKLMESKSLVMVVILVILVLLLLLPGSLYIGAYLPSLLEAIATVFIIGTIFIQIRRYRADKNVVNLHPMIGYIFLLIRGLAMILYRLPDLNIVILRKLSLPYSLAWQLAVLATFLAFIFLGLWAWNFIKVRTFLRTYVVFISLVILVSTVGALIFTLFVFKVIENNNLELMQKGADTESVIMNDRANTAMFIAGLIADDTRVLQAVKGGNYGTLLELTTKYLESSEADILRIYNTYGEIIASPSDPRDKGRLFQDDKTLIFTMTEKKQVRTFATYPGVLADFIVTRALFPLIANNQTIGAIEVGFKFDNAFVDFSKEKTNLDVTIYTGSRISATTLKTADQVSRYVGSEEVNKDVLNNTLRQGKNYTTTLDRFGEIYYSAFSPIRDVNGQIIGMVSVGTPTFLLLDAMRQQLVTTFIIVALLSALISLIGYYLMPSLRASASQIQTKK
jgi:hypothetical protein